MKQITDVISLSLPKDQVYKIVQVAASTKIHTSEEATTPKQGSSLAGDYLSLQPENVVIEESMKDPFETRHTRSFGIFLSP